MTGTGVDPNSCGDITVVPPGRTHAARLGNSGTSAQAERLSYTFEVSEENALFVYDYAVVLQDPNHDESDQPRFEIRVLDSDGQLVSPQCGFYSVTAAANIEGFRSCGNIRYRAWTPVGIDLSDYIGRSVTIEFSTGDCDRGAHYGYAYIAGKCSPLKLDVEYCPANSNVAVISAPAGFTYKWASGETTRSISVVSPPEDFTTSCILTAVTGCQVTLSADIRSTSITPNFTASESCSGMEVQFTDLSVTNMGEFNGWEWDFGDGSPISTSSNPTHIFPGSGTYNVNLSVRTNTGCNAQFNKLVTVYPYPRAAFTSSTTCIGNETHFVNISPIPESISRWEWDFGDGTRNSQQWNTSHTYSAPGEYPVSLVLFSTNDICSDTFVLNQRVANVPVVSFQSSAACFGIPVEFTNTGSVQAGQSAWRFGDNSPVSYSRSPLHTYPAAGKYEVTLTETNEYGCFNSAKDTVEVLSHPRADFVATEVCYGLPTTFTSTSTPPALSSIASEVWDFSDNSISSVGSVIEHTYEQPGDYWVKLVVTGANSCRDSITRKIQVFPKPLLHFQAEREIGCSPFCVNITNLSGVGSGFVDKWYWEFSTGETSNEYVPHICVSNPHPYDVLNVHAKLKAVTNSGCTDSIYIENLFGVSPMPKAAFLQSSDSISILTPVVSFTDSSVGAISWIWNFDDPGNQMLSYLQSPEHEFSSIGEYEIRQIVFNNDFCADTAFGRVVIYPENYLFVPNSFTPDNDGINDTWQITGTGFKTFELIVADRWGQTVFKSNTPELPWNGTMNNSGSETIPGIYPYVIQVIDDLGETHQYRGFVRLIR